MNIDFDNQGLRLIGRIKEVLPVEQTGENYWKQEVILEVGERFPQQTLIRFTNERIKILDYHKIGDNVEVYFKIKSKVYWNEDKVKWVNALEVYRVFSVLRSAQV